jgi:nitrate reductase gamma subunit
MPEILIGRILPVITLFVFIVGMASRFRVWSKLPAPKMTLFPAPSTGSGRLSDLLKETFLFSSLFRGDRSLWVIGWIFHAALALIVVGHLRVVSWLPDQLLTALGLSAASIDRVSAVAGTGAGVVILVTALFLIRRRLIVPRVREISEAGDYLAMFLITAIVVTGDAMRLWLHFDLATTRSYFYGLLTLSAAPVPSEPWFLVHFLLGQFLLMYMPFSKLLHFGGIFFTQSLLQKH